MNKSQQNEEISIEKPVKKKSSRAKPIKRAPKKASYGPLGAHSTLNESTYGWLGSPPRHGTARRPEGHGSTSGR